MERMLGPIGRYREWYPNLVYSELLISSVKPSLISKAPGDIQEALRHKHVSAAGHGFSG